MIQNADAHTALEYLQEVYSTLNPMDAAVFLQLCAEEGVSLHILAKRMALGQSSTMRHVTSLEQSGLVSVHAATDDSLRKTVRLTKAGKYLKGSLF